MWIFLTQLAIKWPFSFPPHPMFASALQGNADQAKYALKLYAKMWKNISDIINHNLKKHHQILIIFGLNISDTTGYWMIISVTTSPNSCFCSTWGKPTKQIMCWSEWKSEWKNFNKFYLSRSLAPNSQLITRFDCHNAMCLPDDIQECLWIQKVTGEVWISLKQNIIDTAVNECRKRLYACVRTMRSYFKQFCCRQLKKTVGWNVSKVSKKVNKYKTCFVRYLD